MTIYKAQKSYIFSNSLFLIFPLLFTIVTMVEGNPTETKEWIGVFGFWMIGIVLILIPLVAKLEVSKEYVKSYLFGFILLDLFAKDILAIKYENLFRGGLGHGKGLNICFLKNGKKKNTSLGEKFWGKEAIEHVKRVLEKNNNA